MIYFWEFTLKFQAMCVIYNMSSLVQVMAWCWFSTKPLPEPMMTCGQNGYHFADNIFKCIFLKDIDCQLGPQEQTSMKFQSKYTHFLWRKCIWKCHLQTGSHFLQSPISDPVMTQRLSYLTDQPSGSPRLNDACNDNSPPSIPKSEYCALGRLVQYRV